MEAMTFRTEDDVRLEGELRMPDDAVRGGAVLCHAHSRHGGSKDHPLLWALRNDLAAARHVAVLGFNFRGVMGSGGTYGGGREEIRDVRAAVAAVQERIGPAAPILVAGWSFGASVAFRAALDDRRIAAVALLGIPLRPKDLVLPPLPEPADLRLFRRPALLLAGANDEFCPPEELEAFAAALPVGTVVIEPGTDHFFWRREKRAAEIVGSFTDRVLRTDRLSS